jgi:GDPmannose 4,6-dehydratase
MRERDELYACSGILFNHESERRPEHFVTRKVTLGAVEILRGKKEKLALGDTSAIRDWSFAGDIMEGAWRMLQQPDADDYVLASGKGHTVEQLVETAFGYLGIDDPLSYVVQDPTMERPEETSASTPNVGNPTKAFEKLGWEAKVSFEELIKGMVDADLRSLQ